MHTYKPRAKAARERSKPTRQTPAATSVQPSQRLRGASTARVDALGALLARAVQQRAGQASRGRLAHAVLQRVEGDPFSGPGYVLGGSDEPLPATSEERRAAFLRAYEARQRELVANPPSDTGRPPVGGGASRQLPTTRGFPSLGQPANDPFSGTGGDLGGYSDFLPKPRPIDGEHRDALLGYRRGVTDALAAHVHVRFNAESAKQLLTQHPPVADTDLNGYLANVPTPTLNAARFQKGNRYHEDLVTAELNVALGNWRAEAQRTARRARAEQLLVRFPPEVDVVVEYLTGIPEDEDAWDVQDEVTAAFPAARRAWLDPQPPAADVTAEARRARLAAYNRQVPATWVLNPLRFLNGVTEEAVVNTPGGATILQNIASANLRPHGASGNPQDATANTRYHTHLSGGSRGLAFIYVKETDGTVTPRVYDIASGRTQGNKYIWTAPNGGQSYNSAARTV